MVRKFKVTGNQHTKIMDDKGTINDLSISRVRKLENWLNMTQTEPSAFCRIHRESDVLRPVYECASVSHCSSSASERLVIFMPRRRSSANNSRKACRTTEMISLIRIRNRNGYQDEGINQVGGLSKIWIRNIHLSTRVNNIVSSVQVRQEICL